MFRSVSGTRRCPAPAQIRVHKLPNCCAIPVRLPKPARPATRGAHASGAAGARLSATDWDTANSAAPDAGPPPAPSARNQPPHSAATGSCAAPRRPARHDHRSPDARPIGRCRRLDAAETDAPNAASTRPFRIPSPISMRAHGCLPATRQTLQTPPRWNAATVVATVCSNGAAPLDASADVAAFERCGRETTSLACVNGWMPRPTSIKWLALNNATPHA